MIVAFTQHMGSSPLPLRVFSLRAHQDRMTSCACAHRLCHAIPFRTTGGLRPICSAGLGSLAVLVPGRRVLRSQRRQRTTWAAAHGGREVPEPAISRGHFAELSPNVRLHYVECRPVDSDMERGTCMLLHGFPDYHGTWRAQMPVLAAAGYRVVAPDLRGYGLSSKPQGVEHYGEAAVAGDIAALAEIVSPDRPLSMLVGHDWGAFAAWAAAKRHASVCDRLAILNVPHPARFAEGLRTPQQLLKSWYTFAFQVPWLPEILLEFADFALLRNLLRKDPIVRLPQAVVEEHLQSFASNPGSMGSAVNYYRAAGRGLWEGCADGPFAALQKMLAGLISTPVPVSSTSDGIIHIPVQVIWGLHDRYLGAELAVPPKEKVPKLRPTRFLEATHWVHWDCAEEVNAELLRFLREC
mmetsp:Transcript_47025/g.131043  ORF Transcript_47025/g.131043 Transcript_47025/m.131043 type:complete len:410 (+) Transcript_47025:73-1302(+)